LRIFKSNDLKIVDTRRGDERIDNDSRGFVLKVVDEGFKFEQQFKEVFRENSVHGYGQQRSIGEVMGELVMVVV
jgi:hypothetical protein